MDMQTGPMSPVERSELPKNTEGLMTWAEMQEWPLTSFTRAETANKFVVTIGKMELSSV